MQRSALIDGVLLAAVTASALSLVVLLRAIPEECPAPSVGVEASGPCLVSGREDGARAPSAAAPRARFDAPEVLVVPPEVAGGVKIQRLEDVETTGSVGPRPEPPAKPAR